MKPKLFAERGQALILIALAAIGLFAVTALAIDGSAKYSDRRHAQNAADTAAMAGALELAREETPNPEEWNIVAKNMAEQNGYDGDIANSQVWAYKCSDLLDDPKRDGSPGDCGPYEGNPQYVQVVIVSYVDTYFARVLGINRTTNAVQAVAHWAPDGPTYGPELLKSLNPNGCSGSNGNIVFGGNGDVTLDGGGAYINSGGGGCGMEFTGCGNLTVVNGSLSSAGDGNINLGTSSETCQENMSVPGPTYNAEATLFTPEMPAEPAECDPALAGSWENNAGVSYLEPGYYEEFPPEQTQSQPIYDNLWMNPGIYCVRDAIKLQEKDLVLYGHDVTIYIRNGGQFDVQGGSIILDAPDDGPYAGYLIIINSDFTGTPPDCKINGNSQNLYEGTIFAPFCDFTFNGTNETGDPDLEYRTQVVAYTITLNGNSNIFFTYNPDNVAQSDPLVGMAR
jgi:hypothetical protein